MNSTTDRRFVPLSSQFIGTDDEGRKVYLKSRSGRIVTRKAADRFERNSNRAQGSRYFLDGNRLKFGRMRKERI